ncbi:MAG: hypothetical protein J5874_06860 [Oscillospiraceae bacterium]|nr:hypothetical protein [Oscillospiraceae bacterium]
MKKLLAIVLCLAIALTAAIAMSVSAFADADPIVWDYSIEDTTGIPFRDNAVVQNWGAKITGEAKYDANEKAFAIIDGEGLKAWQSAYANINTYCLDPENGDQPLADWSVYKWIVVCYKTVDINGVTSFAITADGALAFTALPASPDSYNKLVLDAINGGVGDNVSGIGSGAGAGQFGGVNMNFGWYSSSDIETGGTGIYLKYIAFFATKAEAEAFDFDSYNATEPSDPTPDTSEPETSEPETSEPNQTENSEAEKPNTNTSDVAMISGAVLLCAVAAAVVVVSKKSK